MYDVIPWKDQINCVLEYCTTDLEHIIRDTSLVLRPADVKSFLKMLLEGLAHCHASYCIHRVRLCHSLMQAVQCNNAVHSSQSHLLSVCATC